MPEISQEQLITIVERVKTESCVPFLGAGVNVSSGDYKGLPLGNDLAISILQRLLELDDAQMSTLKDITIQPIGGQVAVGKLTELLDLKPEQAEKLEKIKLQEKVVSNKYFKDVARISIHNLARIALHYQSHIDADGLLRVMRSQLADINCKPSKLLNVLARIPFKLIVTTNYDRLMEKALDSAKRDYKVVIQNVGGFTPADQKKIESELASYSGVVLYKIHGSFSDPPAAKAKSYGKIINAVPNRLIVTEEDYIEFLTVVGKKKEGVPNLITSKIVNSTLLFLGYGLEDWDFRTIFKGLNEKLIKSDQRRSFAIQLNPSEFWEEFWGAKQVTICNMDLYDFADKLEQTYKAHQKAGRGR